jgi:hypothetical protein
MQAESSAMQVQAGVSSTRASFRGDHSRRNRDMKPKHLFLGVALALPLPAAALDQAACSALVGEIETNLKDAALAQMLAATAREPAAAASSAQSAVSTLQIVDRNRQMLEQSGCPPYPRPVDPAGYHNDALRCAYDMLKQRTGTPPCDQSAWTLKGRSETWHALEGEPSAPAPK